MGLREQLFAIRSSYIEEMAENQKSILIFLGILIMTLLGAVLYSNILHAPFVFDDYSSIVDNDTIKNIKASLNGISNSRYLTSLSFALNYATGGLKPFGYHLINNFIHIVNALLVYYLVILTFRTPHVANTKLSTQFIAFSSAFIFISHPIQTQAVTYIAQRAASMATMFYLLSLVMYIKWRLIIDQKSEFRNQNLKLHAMCYTLYAISFISAVLAMKTKEIAFTLPVVIVLYELSFFSVSPNSDLPQADRTPNSKRFLYLLPILLTMLIIPLSILNLEGSVADIAEHIDMQSKETDRIARADYLFTQFRVIVTYLRLLIFPVNQNLDYRYPVYNSFLNPQVFLPFLFLLLIFGIAVYLFYRSRFMVHSSSFIAHSKESMNYEPPAMSYERLIAFGIFWFFITLSVESSIIPIKDVIVEHRLYLPSIGFFIASVSFVDYLLSNRQVKIGLMIVIVVLLSVGTYNRNIIWKNEQTLWEDVIAKTPNNSRAHNELGAVFRDQGKYDKAIEQFEKALKINSNYAFIYYNLGDIQYRLGNYENALAYFKKARKLELTQQLHMDILNSLGMTYSEMGDNEKAITAFKEALQVFPLSIIPYNNLGRQYIKMGKFDLAIDILEKGLGIREEPYLRYNHSLAQAKKMQRDKNNEKAR